MRYMTPYEQKVFNWFTKKADTLENLKKLCKKHFNNEDFHLLNDRKVIEMYEKEKKDGKCE